MEQRLFLNERKSEANDPERMRVRLTRTRLAPFSFDRGILIRASLFRQRVYFAFREIYTQITRVSRDSTSSLFLSLSVFLSPGRSGKR